MLYSIPKLSDALTLRVAEEANGEAVHYALERPGSEVSVKLAPIAVAILMLCDGRATIQNVYRRAKKLGLNPPSQFIEQLVKALYEVGFASPAAVESLEHWLLPDPVQTCEGCGRSCEGHLIGPLAISEVNRIGALFDELVTLVPRLQGKAFVVRIPQYDGLYLNLQEGRCVFLEDDNLCAVHKHFGADAKPSICRTFPYQRVYTETGVRLAVNNACFRYHGQGSRGRELPRLVKLTGSLAELPTISGYAAPYDVMPLSGLPTELVAQRARFLDTEERVIAYLSRDDASVSGLAKLVLGGDVSAPVAGFDVLPKGALLAARDLVRRFSERAKLDAGFIGFIRETRCALGRSTKVLVTDLERLGADSSELDSPPCSPALEDVVLSHLRRLIWLRDVLQFETPQHAIAAHLVGWCVALWASGDLDGVGEHMAGWHRLLTEDDNHRHLFDSAAEANSIIRLFLSARQF